MDIICTKELFYIVWMCVQVNNQKFCLFYIWVTHKNFRNSHWHKKSLQHISNFTPFSHYIVHWVKLLPCPIYSTALSHWVSFSLSISNRGGGSVVSAGYLLTSHWDRTMGVVTLWVKKSSYTWQHHADHKSVEPISQLKDCVSSSLTLRCFFLWETLRPVT